METSLWMRFECRRIWPGLQPRVGWLSPLKRAKWCLGTSTFQERTVHSDDAEYAWQHRTNLRTLESWIERMKAVASQRADRGATLVMVAESTLFSSPRAFAPAALLVLPLCVILFGLGARAEDKTSDPKNNKPAIEGFYPRVIAPARNDTYYFKIMGRNFGQADTTKGFPMVLFDGGNINVDWAPAPPEEYVKRGRGSVANGSANLPSGTGKAAAARIKGYIAPNEREIEIWGVPKAFAHGRIVVKIERGDGVVSDPVELRLAYIDDGQAKWWAGGITLSIFAITIVTASNKKSTFTIAGVQQTLWRVFLLDTESNSYSLSKLQFYLWTFAAVFGYVFLTIARSLVQGSFEFADIPENLPGIIFVSAATTVVAAGAQALKGPKGAGDVQPSFSDFVCAGGVVIAERFQFFVWTLLGVSAFVFLIFFSDAANITTLPAIPQQFLILMGISSAGYLGGKLARKPGPVIDSINVTRTPGPPATPITNLVLEIRGDILSKSASFKIDTNEVKFDTLLGTAPTQTVNPEPVQKADDFNTSGFAKILKLTIDNQNNRNAWLPGLAALTGARQLTIINPDGKLATWNFTV